LGEPEERCLGVVEAPVAPRDALENGNDVAPHIAPGSELVDGNLLDPVAQEGARLRGDMLGGEAERRA
jgi:hypothetical protein